MEHGKNAMDELDQDLATIPTSDEMLRVSVRSYTQNK